MHNTKGSRAVLSFSIALIVSALSTHAQLLWTVGTDDNGWPFNQNSPGDGGGPNATFVQENGTTNPLPGDPASPEFDQQADNDYYFSGIYDSIIPSNGDYVPVGIVPENEEAAERALTPSKMELRYHFNLPDGLKPSDLLSVTFDAVNLDTSAANTDPRYGIEVYFNNVKVQPEILIRAPQLNKAYTSPQFTLEEVNAQAGPGFDNIVTLRGVPYNNDGGGNWMGIDYVQLNQETEVIPPAVFPWIVGKDDDGWPAGNGGGENASFVKENETVNPLPGVPNSPETDLQADNDYYFAGSYTTVIPASGNVPGNGDYTPVGLVAVNEEAAERALTTGNTELRYHFNLPNTLKPSDLLSVSFEPLNLQDPGGAVTDPQFGAEIYVNGVRVMPEAVIRPTQLKKAVTSPPFTLQSVGAQVGAGFDNIVTIKGISHAAQGGGNSMGIDYVRLDPVAQPPPAPILPWTVGINDNGWPTTLRGGGPNAAFVQENNVVNPLPGDPNSPAVDKQADNDYYLGGVYSTVITGNGTYAPVGTVSVNEEAAERALTPGDTELRYHFNLPANLSQNDQLSVAFDALNLDDTAADPHYGVEVYVNSVKVLPEVVISPTEVGVTYSTAPFTLASVNAQAGPGFDNIVTLKGISKSAEGGGDWMGIDYVQMNPVLPPPFPWSVGKDDNGQPAGNGGGPNTSFVQENGGSNPLPGNPNSPEVNQQSDDDYYFAGDYTTPIQSVVDTEGDYTPVGTVLVNEESAERAFAGSDNTKRYHFNLPSTLKPTDQLMITYDIFNLDTRAENFDPQYGIEVLFNDVLLQPEVIIRPEDIDRNITVGPFTVESVNAKAGPGFDNIVTLHGINHSADGGGNWMGIDFVRLDPLPQPVFPLVIGKDDNDWPAGDGGAANASFVQENGSINLLPGNPSSPEINRQADNDYYFAGIYSNTIPSVVAEAGDYTPVGIVPANEEAAERAFAGADNDLRYHFNLPTTLKPTNQLVVTFDPLNLEDASDINTEPRYGIEIYFNGVKVQDEIIIRTNDLGVARSTAPFTLASVNAEVGLGADNILSLRGINHSAEGGGNWMGFDYVKVSGPDVTPPTFTSISASAGTVTLNWTGGGTLQSAPSLSGPWTAVAGASNPPYSESIVAGQNRFYRVAR